MIRIVSTGDGSESDLSGSPHELSEIARRIADWIASEAAQLEIAADTECDPAPYDLTLARFVLHRSSGPIRLAVDSGALVARGSAEAFAHFAPWFEFPPDTPTGNHVQFDNVCGDDYIHDSTIPLVISCAAV